MNGKLTLITPPDFYENLNRSILFFNLSDDEQDTVSRWLGQSEVNEDLNLYVYTNEVNLPWIFYAAGRCEYKYINFDNANTIVQSLGSYLIARNDVYFKVEDQNIASIYSHISNNRVNSVETFLESVLIDKRS